MLRPCRLHQKANSRRYYHFQARIINLAFGFALSRTIWFIATAWPALNNHFGFIRHRRIDDSLLTLNRALINIRFRFLWQFLMRVFFCEGEREALDSQPVAFFITPNRLFILSLHDCLWSKTHQYEILPKNIYIYILRFEEISEWWMQMPQQNDQCHILSYKIGLSFWDLIVCLRARTLSISRYQGKSRLRNDHIGKHSKRLRKKRKEIKNVL